MHCLYKNFRQYLCSIKKNTDVSLKKKKKKKKKKKNCGGLLSIVCDFWVLVATVGVWKKWNLRFGKVWKSMEFSFQLLLRTL